MEDPNALSEMYDEAMVEDPEFYPPTPSRGQQRGGPQPDAAFPTMADEISVTGGSSASSQ